MKIFNFFKKISSTKRGKSQQWLYNYYKKNKYKIIPVLPSEKEAEKLHEQANQGFVHLVPKEYMIPIDNNLLRAHIVMLWWLKNINRNKPPLYFLYDYGIDFNKELSVLKNKDILITIKSYYLKVMNY